MKKQTLSGKQARFMSEICKLVLWALEIKAPSTTMELSSPPVPKYRVRFGDAYRDSRAFIVNKPYGRSDSLHKSRLAVDLILDRWDEEKQKYVYCRKTEDYRELGMKWVSMGDDHEWGGFRSRNDGNHFSISHRGRW